MSLPTKNSIVKRSEAPCLDSGAVADVGSWPNVQFRDGEAPAEPSVFVVQWLGRSLAVSPSHADSLPRLHPFLTRF
jgi:hypothetical protein